MFDLQCFILLYNICVCHLFNKEISKCRSVVLGMRCTVLLWVGFLRECTGSPIGCLVNSLLLEQALPIELSLPELACMCYASQRLLYETVLW